MFFIIYNAVNLDGLQTKFVKKQVPVCLHIRIERENLQSMLAVEQIFAQMHAIHANTTFAQRNFEGVVLLPTGMEIVSMGGKISYIVRTFKQYVGLIEASFYAQYPNAEISVVEDYMAGLTKYDKDSTWDLWGTEFVMVKDYAYPLKTYKDFEHMAAEEKIIDPIAPLLEAMSKAEPHELMAIQFLIRPVADNDWVPHVQEFAKKLKGESTATESALDKFTAPLNMLGEKTVLEAMFEKKKVKAPDGTAAAVQRLSRGETDVLTAVEEKMSKTGWHAKIRMLYIAPKAQFDGSKKTALIGGFRTFSGMNTNNLKPDVGKTWTDYGKYALSKSIEQPYLDYRTYTRKKHFLSGFVKRSMWIGAAPMVLNTEELATLYHFPLSTTKVPPVETIDVRKGQPPANLPVFTG